MRIHLIALAKIGAFHSQNLRKQQSLDPIPRVKEATEKKLNSGGYPTSFRRSIICSPRAFTRSMMTYLILGATSPIRDNFLLKT